MLALAGGCLTWATPTLTLTPDFDVHGDPGDTVGWGYTIVNDTGFYLLFDSSNFCGLDPNNPPFTADPAFADCNDPYNPPTAFGPQYGTYQDYIANNITLIAPNSTSSQSFDAGLMQGVGAYIIDPSAPSPAMDIGAVWVSYMEYNGNPFLGGTQVSGDIEMFANAQVDVVPEPATLGLAGGALLLLAALRRRVTRK